MSISTSFRIDYKIGEMLARLVLRDSAAADYFDSFLDRSDGSEQGTRFQDDILVECIGSNGPVFTLDGVALSTSLQGQTFVWSSGASRRAVWDTARRFLRDHWLLELITQRTVLFIHASAIIRGRNLVIFAGDKYAGKTTLLLDSILNQGWSIVTNDCLVLVDSGGSPQVTCIPTYARIRASTVERFTVPLHQKAEKNILLREELKAWSSKQDDPNAAIYAPYGAFGKTKMHYLDLDQFDVSVVAVRGGQEIVRVDRIEGDPEACMKVLRDNLKNELERGVTGGTLAAALPADLSFNVSSEKLLRDFAIRIRLFTYAHQWDVAPILKVICDGCGDSARSEI